MPTNHIVLHCNICGGSLCDNTCKYCGAEFSPDRPTLISPKRLVKEAILNISRHQLEAAEKVISACERIDSEYVGTLTSKLCYLLMQATMPNVDVRMIYAEINRSFKLLQQKGAMITGEEKSISRYIDNADAFAIMLLAFDGLNDIARRDYILGLLSIGEVQSPDLNRNLLNYAIKNGNFPMVDAIISNNHYLNTSHALGEMLANYPDTPQKAKNLESLIQAGNLNPADSELFEQYILNSGDSVTTKSKIILSALQVGLKPSVDFIITQILLPSDVPTIKEIISALCRIPMTPREFDSILSFAFMHECNEIAVKTIKCIRKSNQQAYASSDTLMDVILRNSFESIDIKLQFISELIHYTTAEDLIAVLQQYLCAESSADESRIPVLQLLIESVDELPLALVEDYMLHCGIDGESKRDIASILLCHIDLNQTPNLISSYLLSNVDDIETRTDIVILMQNYEMTIDPRAVLQYICLGSDTPNERCHVLRKLIESGTQIPANAMSLYLEKSDLRVYLSEMLDVLAPSAGVITDNALTNYVLYCKEQESVKVRRCLKMSKLNGSPFGTTTCEVDFNRSTIRCNLMQAYLLLTKDSYEITANVIATMLENKAKFTDDIVINNMSHEKFKKYLQEHKDSLRSVSSMICEEYKLFSKFGIL